MFQLLKYFIHYTFVCRGQVFRKAGLMLLFSLVGFAGLSLSLSKSDEADKKLLQEKVDFILNIASNVQLSEDSGSKNFIIAVYGRDTKSRDLYKALEDAVAGKKIQSKPIEVKLFRRMFLVKEADLIYINGETKVSLAELDEKVGRKFVLVTEDFPYGQSMINFVADEDGLSYSIQEDALEKQGMTVGSSLKSSKRRIVGQNSWAKRLEQAKSKIEAQKAQIKYQQNEIGEKSKTIEEKSSTIENQESTISEKTEKIKESERVINYQRTIIIVCIIGGIIILGLLFFLYRTNQNRKKALLESEAKTQEIISSINYAERIQRASLPSTALLEQSLRDGFIFYEPKDIVSGDFYWIEEKDGVTYFAVADCTGHGVPGALLSVLCSNSLSRAINEMGLTEPARILDQTVILLEGFFAKSEREVQDGMDIALCRLDKFKNQLQYAGANRPLYYFSEGAFNEIKADRQPIGKYDHRKQYTNHILHLKQGDSVYLFSDGIVDQFGGERSKKYTSRRLKSLLESIKDQPMDEQKVHIQQELETWRGENEPIDDVCMLGVRF